MRRSRSRSAETFKAARCASNCAIQMVSLSGIQEPLVWPISRSARNTICHPPRPEPISWEWSIATTYLLLTIGLACDRARSRHAFTKCRHDPCDAGICILCRWPANEAVNPSIAMNLMVGIEVPSIMPLYVALVAIVLFVGLALWIFQR